MFHSIQIANSTWGLSPCANGNDDDLDTKEVFDSMLHELKHPAGAILELLSSGQCSGQIMAAAEY